jgi:hypothetical protein
VFRFGLTAHRPSFLISRRTRRVGDGPVVRFRSA